MKKFVSLITALLLLLSMAFALTSCDDEKENQDKEESSWLDWLNPGWTFEIERY